MRRDREATRQYQAQWYQQNKEYQRDQKLRRAYGVSLAEYKEMLAKQDGRCALCGDNPHGKVLHVDHDHATGVVRGLLCRPCNTAIGLLRDDPALIERVAEYVRRSRRDNLDMPELGEGSCSA